jgi:hypothetical protein
VLIDNPVAELVNGLQVEILTDEIAPAVSIRPNHDGSLYTCSFIPQTLCRHMISIDYAGLVAEQNPFHCDVIQEKDIQLTGPAISDQCLVLNEPTHFYFKLKDFLPSPGREKNVTYESGYSSNDDNSLTTSSKVGVDMKPDEENNYRVTITDGHGRLKSNVNVQETDENRDDNVRVDFVPDEKIFFINISCTW